MTLSSESESVAGLFDGLVSGPKRYERKFFVTDLSTPEVTAIVTHNPALFREIFHLRQVNNLYLDSPGRGNYVDNVVGAQQRQKVRIRWYGDLLGELAQPTLEVKIKNGLVGFKRSLRLPQLDLAPGFDFRNWLDLLRLTDLPDCLCAWLSAYEPTLLNRYSRRYFLSDDGRFRATIDSTMQFGLVAPGINSLARWADPRPDTVLELKYDPDYDLDASEVTIHFPFRITKSSKYVTGIDLLYN